jgi:hypothetical protein
MAEFKAAADVYQRSFLLEASDKKKPKDLKKEKVTLPKERRR